MDIASNYAKTFANLGGVTLSEANGSRLLVFVPVLFGILRCAQNDGSEVIDRCAKWACILPARQYLSNYADLERISNLRFY